MSYFQEAKAHFVASHQHPINQILHHLTNILAIAAVILLFVDWRLTLLCLVLTQVFAIGGHIVFEKNEPAFVKYRNGIMILASMSWSFERWFGLRPLLTNYNPNTNHH
ncbi:Mpo1-like protein [Pantanalinema rosaneae CENA516]|uniref:Mpo1-like protein n=1 Tax=Pantanalinema rosaneae TaxID=1620701 RepID=UPI003D6DB3A7